MRYGSNTRYGFPDFPELEDGLLFYAPYNGIETFENNYTGNAISVKGQMPIMAGGVIFRHGINDNYGRSKALQMASAVTNLWTNPSVETNTTGYNVVGGSTLTRTYQYSRYGSYCLKVVTAAGIGSGWQTPTGLAGMAIAAATSYVFSLYAFGTAGEIFTMAITWYNGAGAVISTTTQNVTLTGSWKRFIFTATSPALTAFAAISFYTAVAAVRTCYVDGVQFEQSTYITPYCDGSLGTGHAWTGAAHASTSTRVAATLAYSAPTTCINPLIGTVSAWVYIDGGSPAWTQTVLDAPGSTAGRIIMTIINGSLGAQWGTAAAINAAGFTSSSFHHVAMTYDGITLRLYYEGAQVASGAMSGFSGTVASFNVARGAGGASQLNGFIDDLAVWDRVLTADEIAEIHSYGKALGWMPTDYEYTCDDPEYYSINNVSTYVADQDNKANITHMYHYDTSTGTFSTNLMTAALPYNLLPDPMGVGDILYIGCETALLDSGPFFSAIFDYLGSVTGIEITWEYYDAAGAAWSTVNSLEWDDTQYPPATLLYSFDPQRQGSRSVWLRPRTVNTGLYTLVIGAMNITGYWIRGRITAVPTTTPPPVQTRRYPFAPTWSAVKVPKESADGDTPSEIQMQVDNLFYGNAGNPGAVGLYIGSRSIDRGDDFKSRLNFADEQNPTGATCTLVSASASFQTHYCSPTGRELQWAPAAAIATWTDIAYIGLLSPLAEQYWGSFAAFARLRITNPGVGYMHLRLQILAGTTVGGRAFTSNEVFWNNSLDATASFGTMHFPEGFSNYRIYLQGMTDNNTMQLNTVDLALIPCDESLFYTNFYNRLSGLAPSYAYGSNYLLINELDELKPEIDVTKSLRGYDDANLQDRWANNTIPPFIQSKADQKLHIFPYFAPAQYRRAIFRISPRHSANYLIMRGNE